MCVLFASFMRQRFAIKFRNLFKHTNKHIAHTQLLVDFAKNKMSVSRSKIKECFYCISSCHLECHQVTTFFSPCLASTPDTKHMTSECTLGYAIKILLFLRRLPDAASRCLRARKYKVRSLENICFPYKFICTTRELRCSNFLLYLCVCGKENERQWI